LVLLPFHAFLTVWLASATGHYILLRLWKECSLLVLVAGVGYLLIKDRSLRQKFLGSRLIQLIILYLLLTIAGGAIAYGLHKVTAKALGYGLIVNLRFLTFFLVNWAITAKSPKLKQWWPKLLLFPAALVILVGLIQRLALPYDVLKHFGYSERTIFPYETINHNIHYPRIMSTLRGANPLGAYLILIMVALSTLWIKFKRYRLATGVFWLAAFVVLIFSYSRAAWLGLLAGLALLVWLWTTDRQSKRLFGRAVALLVIMAAVLALALRHNPGFENAFLHTQNRSGARTSSNQSHVSAFRKGVHDALHEPVGRGVGTAGPASVYNNGKVRVAENYFIQIAQELGWIGLALFIIINYLVAYELWQRRNVTLALVLLTSLLGLTIVNLFSHAWTDDTLAYVWWGLAGVALAPAILDDERKQNVETQKAKS